MRKVAARPRTPAIECPHCGARGIIRTSTQITPLYRELRVRCDDDSCGHSFVAELSIVRTVHPSARPNPTVHLPMSLRAERPANDDAPVAANDDGPAPIGQPIVSI